MPRVDDNPQHFAYILTNTLGGLEYEDAAKLLCKIILALCMELDDMGRESSIVLENCIEETKS